jgi:3-deoxy-D-manno-octulosonic-acid transferase
VHFYFLCIRIAALLGHKKAQQLVRGQKQTKANGERLKANAGAIWFHAASVGEFEQARPLIERLRREQPNRQIVVTFFSPSGYEARKNYDQADGIYYLPFATRRNAKRFLEALQPSMAIFVKYEFWPAYLRELKKRNIPTYSICSIFRPNQVFFKWWGRGYRKVLRCFTHLFVQDEASQALLTKYGITNVSVAGDTRFDRMYDVQKSNVQGTDRLTPVAHFAEGHQRVLVAGSTWPKDEALLAQYMHIDQATKLILVPHELDEKHMHYIFNLFQGRIVRYSDVSAMTDAVSRRNILQHASILLVDTMGLLSSIYRFGQAAYIGGGFGVGIHNTIEAAAYGIPVVFGPNYHHFREAQGLIDAGAARSIKTYHELAASLTTALDQHEYIGAKAAKYIQSELGTTEKIYKYIFS